MCDYRKCHSPHGHENECEYCKYENDHKRYERAYKYNNITNACEKTCSWRPDSTRCFPGYCSDEYAETCNCTTGFDSPLSHCTTNDLSGVDYYEIELFELETAKHDSEGIEIKENVAPIQHIKGITNLSTTVEVTNTGIYAVHLICFDIAGNHKTARAFFLYDNNDIIDLGKGQIEVKNTQHYLERRWITDSSALIEVEWKDRFIKTDHVKHNWLAAVQPLSNIESTYDDRSGKRTAKSVEHVKGIVRFEIVHDVYGTKLKSISTFAQVSNVYAEFDARNVIWDDGDQLISTIRAFDILENYRDETIITYKDSTPPVISNLWLTKGDRVNTAVHSLKELNEMTIEWDVYDYHSGISHLKWRLYSNYSGTVIIHGEIDLPGQGKTQTITECEEKYNTSRGPACYCTKHTGCYHKHFFLKPHIVVGEGNGIVHNRSMGEHDSDYFIDVNVTNMATLVSLKTIKITVDITPPEVGHVNDGVFGSPEVDFQQDLRLDAHWEGFFDRESGVAFYQYEFSDMNDTVNTFAMYDAPSSGTYYVTVVAYNKAFHMSKPVCSDGVTITTTIPSDIEDIDFLAATDHLAVRWTKFYHPHLNLSYYVCVGTAAGICDVDGKRKITDFWSTFNEMDYQYISINQNTKLTARGLSLEPGRTYRLSLKFCAGDVCFPAIKTSGVTIIPNKPVTGPISIDYTHHTNDTDKSQLTIHLLGQIDFSKCRIFALRGYNGAGVSQTTFAEIKPCKGQDVVPKIVLDATGEQQLNRDGSIIDGYGHEIYLEETGRWNIEDVDYTPYKNILSAVWHSLRHKNFTWAVIEINTLDALTYYKDFNTIHLSDPCSHPDVVTCGHTESAYINVLFKDESPLEHGKRYTICIHAPSKTLEYETYTEVLQETNECSDGITVDLIPPLTGTIWIGPTTIIQYKFQISTSDIFVNWESFLDIEEYGTASHSTGILQYQVAIGSVEGGSDIVENTNVGIVNHVTFHNLHLQNGHDYFASVKGIDFSGRSSTAHSASVRVDTTPPHLTSKPILIDGRHIRSFTEIQACWKDVFYDLESGIAYYMLEVGSKANIGDIVQSIETTEDCGVPIQYLDIDAHQGHAYFLTVKAVNKANLVTTSSSWGYIYDQSPPEVGQVFDGFLQEDKLNSIDIDFQIDSTQLGAYWKEFYDPHTTIKTYRINVGTCVGCDDVLQAHDVGIIYEFVLKGMNLAIGKIYYTTVTACNTADLCSSVTSDGFIIDNSPPNIGKVKDGADYIDINYQSLRSYVSATWRGFNDPQSGLDKYSFRVGTLLGGDDIISKSELPLTDIAVFSNTSITDEIPTNIRIYITVRAYNKAGLNSEATSNGFLVDDSPPFFSRKPELFQQLGSRRENSIIYRSCMKITWEVSDEESFIERQYISVISHKGGEINSTSTELNGIVRDFTYTRLDLHDGGIYFVTVIACNSAKVCVKKTSDGIFVDNSPPITGTFAIETEHAASLHRHVDGWWMKWSTFKLWLAWIGFSDLHSGIDYYMVSVGSRYMLDDLNSENKPEKFHHNGSGVDKGDEGKVQTFEVDTTKLTDYNYVFISIWAFNNVGLQSDMIHSQFRLIPGGPLELIRRCTSNTCRGHCVCAPKDQRCPIKGTPCVDNTNNNTNTLIAIYDVTDIRELEAEDISFTPSHDILAARWRIVQIQGLLPQWYEWSVGITESIEPEGIIDSSVENVWHPCGQIDNAIYTLPRGKVLNDFQMYSFFVRTWYDSNTFADFKSDGVTVMSKPLTKTNVFGVGVKEHLPGHWKKDIDYILRGGLFTISWHEAFVKASTVIEKFHVYLSTYPGGHDVHKVEIDIPGSVSAVNISRVSLLPGVKYYSNVVGYSYSGQHLTLSSDGFTVDVDKPSVGVVNDGIGHIEIDFQNTSHFVSASWNGFGDHDSGIRKYYWCVQSEFSETDCDVLPYLNVGIQRSISKSINSSIVHSGAKIFSKVYAVDFVGHVSDTATSNGFTIDETPPTPVQLMFTENNMIKNPSFEDSDNNFVDILNMSTTNICGYSKPDHWNSSDNDCICVVGSSKSIAMDGRSFLFLRGSVLQTLYNLEKDNFYSVIFFTAHVPFEDSVLSTKEGYIEFGNERHVFLVYQKQDKHGSEIDVSWHSHTFYFTARNKDVNITYGSMDDTTGILIDKIQFSKVEIVDVRTHPYPILSHAVWLHGWSSIHASWHFVDEESPIVEYLWAIGYKEGSTEIQRYTSVGLNTFAYNYNITLTHTSQVHITVIAINGAGLSSVATAEALFIDLTAPDIEFIYDGIGYDIDSQTTDEIIANWKVEDLESGLSHCEWAVGFSEFGNEIQAFVRISTELSSVSKVFDHSLLASRKVYVTLRCHNKAGLHTKKSSDGVTISDSPPSIQSAQVQILDQPITEYSSKQNFHGNTSIVRLKWMGFEDKSGLDSFHVDFENQNKTVSVSKTILYDHDGDMYCSMTGLDLHDGHFEVRVSAINNAFLSSQPVSTNMSVSTIVPKVSETKSITMSENETNRTLTISWDTYFISAFILYYEVSVGTALNGADIVQWQETTNGFLVMHVPLQVKLYNGMTIYITITAIGPNGKHTTKTIALTV
ncbi:uncharacterized protein LOC143057491 [Mytilus galloprovincialis]|uniref:uncharacterized protein LOC143057491 n=1 Tax=Mytilus galloprovincialis TaxID=29158 RepID=UPI003F7C41CA